MSTPGLWELVALAVLALLIFGPDKLPGMLRSAGKTLGGLRREARAAVRELKETGELDELQEVARDLRGESEELRRAADIRGSVKRPPRSARGIAAAAAGSIMSDAVSDDGDQGARAASTDDDDAGDHGHPEAAEEPTEPTDEGAAAQPVAAGPAPFDPDAT